MGTFTMQTTPITFIQGTASTVSDDLWAMVLRGVDCSGYLTTRMRIKTTLPPAASTANNNETSQYFYHSDHLGSSSFISDAIGYATQHLQYLPYGETFVDQHGAFDSRYTFSAKEKDDETQYSYFGARYYDSDLSVWLSIDPMAGSRSWISPYNYCQWNPVGRVDPSGALDGEWNFNTASGEMTWMSNKGGQNLQIIHFSTPSENGGMIEEGTAYVDGPKAFAGAVRGGWAASSVDYWAGIPSSYNSNTKDYLKGGLYEYSALDLQKRYQIFNDPKLAQFKGYFAEKEATGNAEPISLIEFRRQYIAKWETDKTLWFAIEAGYWAPASYSSVLDDGLSYLKNLPRLKNVMRYTPIYSVYKSEKTSGNSWNQFLRETKGYYKGADWIKKASEDYKIWKMKRTH